MGMAAERRALVYCMLYDERQDEHAVDVANVQLFATHRDALALSGGAPLAPRIEKGTNFGLHHLARDGGKNKSNFIAINPGGALAFCI